MRQTLHWPSAWGCWRKGQGQWRPTPASTGVLPDPPAVIPGVWLVEPSVGASRPGDVPGDPSAAFPYSLWVLRGSFAAVSLKVMERREGLFHGQHNSLRLAFSSPFIGAELGSVRSHYNLNLSAELPQPTVGPPPFPCRPVFSSGSPPYDGDGSHPSPFAQEKNLGSGRPPIWPPALSVGLLYVLAMRQADNKAN